MSSPITTKKRGRFDEALIAVHQRLSHGRRIEVLAQRIAAVIRDRHPAGEVRCLDVGCGDMQIAERVADLAPGTIWTCTDIHELPAGLQDDVRWRKYQKFDGLHLPFPDRSFDVVLFCDVLHHVQTNAVLLLAEAARTGSSVIIKDHFEYSLFSRMVLWAMDFVGNWGYGVSLPKRYFTRQGFEDIAGKAGLRTERIDTGIDLYAHIPVAGTILRPAWQFIAVLEPDVGKKR